MQTLLQQGLVTKPSLIHGYGVFADKTFKQDSIIEECYAIISSGKDDSLRNYYFQTAEICFLPSGYGLLYNHADIPNARYYFDETRHLLVFEALRHIYPGEEIVINYGKTWFSYRGLSVKKMSKWRKLLRFSLGVPLRTTLIIIALLLANQWLHVLAVR